MVKSYYPNILTRPYSVPPLHFNRVPYDLKQLPSGQYVLVQRPPGQQSAQEVQDLGESLKLQTVPSEHAQDDFAQQHVLANLQVLAESRHEPQFIVTELDFKDYLNAPEHRTDSAKFPRKV